MMSGFANFNMGEGEGGDDELSFMPMMQGMMKSLLSKDVLYPSLKEISAKVRAALYLINKQEFRFVMTRFCML